MLTPMEISQPQNTINGATPADLSRDGDSGQAMLPEIARNAIAMRREQEQLLSDEAYTKALKASTMSDGTVNHGKLNALLSADKNFRLWNPQNVGQSVDNARRQAELANMFNSDTQKAVSMYNRGLINKQQLANIAAWNGQSATLAASQGAGDTEMQSKIDALKDSTPETVIVDQGNQKTLLNRQLGKNNYSPQGSLPEYTSPDTATQVASRPVTISGTDQNGNQISVTEQPRPYARGGAGLTPLATTNTFNQQRGNEINAEVLQAQKDFPTLSNENAKYDEAANSAFNNRNNPNLSYLSDVAGIFGLNPGDMANRQVMNKAMYNTLVKNGASSDLARNFESMASGANTQQPEVANMALFLNQALLRQKLLHSQYLLNHMHDQNFTNNAYSVSSKYGKYLPEFGMLDTLMEDANKNPARYNYRLQLMQKYMPKQLQEINKLLPLYQQAEKEGVIPQGSFYGKSVGGQ